MAEEKLDIFDDKYEFVGTAGKKEAHEKGMWHRVFTCLLLNTKTKSVLMQKKVPSKYNFDRPDYLDISVGGHYQAGEELHEGIRELEEEVGVKVNFEDLVSLGVRQLAISPAENYIIREFMHIFLCPMDIDLKEYKLEEVEVAGLVELPIDKTIDLLNDKIKKIDCKGIFQSEGKQTIHKLEITTDDFIPSYLKGDQFMLRLLIAAKRYLKGDSEKEIFW